MCDELAHRGPDDRGVWSSTDGRVALAHRRLSIVDLSAAAAQPMGDGHGNVVVFNGEIYNHTALRGDLEIDGLAFTTDHSDTEVLLRGFRHWGPDELLERLDGDFAFAVWDESSDSLTLARDRVGVKPLYFSVLDGTLVFASEIKAILRYPGVSRELEPSAMYHYLSFLTTPAPLTMFRGIFKLPAGFVMNVDSRGIKIRRYWDALPGNGFPVEDVAGMSLDEELRFYVSGVRTRVEDAVEKRMMADVPIGVFLSGGVDSSTNVALMSKFSSSSRVSTFTVGFRDHTALNELSHARRVAELYDTDHHEILIDEDDMVGYLEQLIYDQDEPIADWVCVPLYFVSKLAREKGVRVVQVGEGADEQFSGYASYMAYLRLYRRYWRPFRAYLPGSLQRSVASVAAHIASRRPSLSVYSDIIDRAARNREYFWSGATVFPESLKRSLLNLPAFAPPKIDADVAASGLLPESYLQTDSFNIVSEFFQRIDARFPNSDPLTRMAYAEFKLRLPELLLMRVDKITMSNSLEARVPFLDHRLVEFTMDIPQYAKVHGGEPKYLLKKAVEDLLPHDLIYREKQGFGAPMSEWLRGRFGSEVRDRLSSSRLADLGYFDMEAILNLVDEHQSGAADHGLYIWTIFNLFAWFDYWIDDDADNAVSCHG